MTDAPGQGEHDAAVPVPTGRPGELVGLAAGVCVYVRPLQPEDADRLVALFGRLSRESVRRRFLLQIKEPDPRQAQRLANVDHRNQEALAAVGDNTPDGSIVAVARYARTSDQRAELGLLVEDAYQHLGLGRILLDRLAAVARANGIKELHGETLPDNEPMLHLLRSTRYPLRTAVIDRVCTFTLRLDASRA